TNGQININIVGNIFDYACSLLSDGYRLKKEWASDSFWSELIPNITYGQEINEVIKSALNVQKFSSIAVMSMWDTYSEFQRQLIWIWYQLNGSDDYCGYVFRRTKNINDIKNSLRDEIVQC